MTTFDEWNRDNQPNMPLVCEHNCASEAVAAANEYAEQAYLAGLRAAAKMVCQRCNAGYVPENTGGVFIHHGNSIYCECKSNNIHREIAEMRRKEEHNMGEPREPWYGTAVAMVRLRSPSITLEQWADRMMMGDCELRGWHDHGQIGGCWYVSISLLVEVPGNILKSSGTYHIRDIAHDAITSVPGVDLIEFMHTAVNY